MKPITTLTITLLIAACTGTVAPTDNGLTTRYESVQPATMMSAPESRRAAESSNEATRGRYLVELLGCATCHTDGALVGQPRMDRWMAGSRVGIAYSNPLEVENPGIVFPRNLTPDKATGLGNWTNKDIASLIRTGVGRHGRVALPVMPWPAFSRLGDKDLAAIVAYLRSLPPVTHRVPDSVPAGVKTKEQFVHFGAYRSKR